MDDLTALQFETHRVDYKVLELRRRPSLTKMAFEWKNIIVLVKRGITGWLGYPRPTSDPTVGSIN